MLVRWVLLCLVIRDEGSLTRVTREGCTEGGLYCRGAGVGALQTSWSLAGCQGVQYTRGQGCCRVFTVVEWCGVVIEVDRFDRLWAGW